MAEDRSAPQDPPDLPLARAVLRRRRLHDAGIALQVAGIALFASPFVDVYGGIGARTGLLFGLPAGPVLLFAVWFALIALAARLARRQPRDPGEG